MSTRDERVVSLKFDNAQFERGASESMSTLDKLKEKLKFKDSEKDLDKLQKSVDSVKFDKITKSLESLEKRFSTMGIAGMRIIENLTDKALQGLGKLESETIGQIRRGGWSRAMNLANAQFQIEGLGYSWNKVLESVNYAVDGTAYGLDAAASAASQLAASGVDFTKILKQVGNEGITQMHVALRGISGVAAMSNSSYEEIAHVFTRIAGQGRVMATDLNSIATRGLNATAELAKYLKVTEADVKDLVRQGKIDFMTFADAMDSAFGEHAKDANKTFQGSLSNIKAALSRIGALFAQPVVDKSNVLFNAIRTQINNAKAALSDFDDEKNGIHIDRFQTHFSEAWEAMINSVTSFVDSIKPDWFQGVANAFDKAAIKMRDFFISFGGIVEGVKEKVEAAKEAIIIPLQDAMAAFDIFFNGKYGNGNARVRALQAAGRDAKKVQTLINEWYKAGFDPAKLAVQIEGTNAADLAEWLKEVSKNGYKLDQTQKKLGTSTMEAADAIEHELTQEQTLAWTYYYLSDSLEKLAQTTGNCFKIIGNTIKGAWQSIKKTLDPLGTAERINSAITWFHDLTEEIKRLTDFSGLDRIEELSDQIANGAENAAALNEELKKLVNENKDQQKVRDTFDSLARSVSNVWTVMKNLATAAWNIGKAIGRAFRNVFSPSGLAFGVEEVTWTLADFSEVLVNFSEKVAPAVEGAATLVFSVVKTGISLVKDLFVKVVGFFSELAGGNEQIETMAASSGEVVDRLQDAPSLFDKIGNALKRVADWFGKIPVFFHELSAALSDNEGIKRLQNSFSGFGDKVDEVVSKLKPIKKDVSDAIGNQNESKSAAEVIAGAIGWVADKLAAVVEWAPRAVDAVTGFFVNVRKKISEFFGGTDRKDTDLDKRMAAIYGMPQTINEAVSPENAEETSKNVGSFFGKIGEAIKNAFKSVNFGELKNLAILGVTLYSLVSLGRTADRVSSVPKSISKLFKGIGDALTNYTIAMREQVIWAARLKFLEGLVLALISLSGWIVIMGSIDQLTLSRGLAVMLFLTVIISVVTGAIAKMNASKQSKILQQNGIVNMYNTVSGLAAIGALLLGFAGVMYSLAKTMAVLDGLKNVERSLGGVVGLFLVLSVWVGVMVGLMVFLTKKLQPLKTSKLIEERSGTVGKLMGGTVGGSIVETEKNPLTGPLLGLAAVLISISVAVGILAVAAALISATKVNSGAILLVSALIGVIALSVAGMIAAAGKFKTDVWQLLGIAATVIAFALAIKIMATSLVALFAEAALISKLGGEAGLNGMMGAVTALILVIVAIGGAVALMASQMSKLSDSAVWAVPVAIAAMVAVVAASVILISKLATIDRLGATVGAAIGILVVMLGGIALIMAILTKRTMKADALYAFSVSMIAFAGAAYIIALALEKIAAIPVGGLVKAGIALGAFMAAFAAITIFSKPAVLKALAKVILSIGGAVLLAGVGLRILAAGIAKLIPLMPAAILSLEGLFKLINKYKFVSVLITVIIVALSLVAYKLAPIFDKIVGVITGAVKRIVDSDLGKSIINFFAGLIKGAIDIIKEIPGVFKSLGHSLVEGAKNLSPKVKTMIGIIMAAIGAGFSENGEGGGIFGALGRFIDKVFLWLVNSLPTIVDRIVVLIVTVIESVALAISNHSGRIAAAIWAIVTSVTGLLVEVIDQALRLLPFGDAIANVLHTKELGEKISKRGAVGIAQARLDELNAAKQRGESVSAEELAKAEADLRKAIDEWEDADKFKITRERLDEVMADVKLYDRLLEKQRSHIELTKEEEEAMKSAQINWAWFRNNQTAIQGTSEWQQWMADNETIDKEIKKLRAASTAELEDISHAYHWQEIPKEFLGYHVFLNYDEEDIEKYAQAAEAELRARADAIPQNVNASTMQYWDAAAKDQYMKAQSFIKAADEGFKDAFDASIHQTFAEGSIDEMMSSYYSAAAMDQAKKYRQNQIDKNLSQTTASYSYMESAAKDQAAKYVESWTGSVKKEASNPSTGVAATTKKEVVEPIKKEVDVLPDYMKDVGKFSVEGFANGLENNGVNFTSVVDKVFGDNGGGILGFVTKKLGVESPSKVFAQIGSYCMQGFANGVTNDTDLATLSMSNLARRTIDAFGNPLEYVSKIMSGELTYDPSIRPIMDMSSIRYGADSVNGMFQNQNVAISGFSGRLAADIGQLQRDNQDVVDELALLREDMNEMTERMTNLQVIMDNGALVGQLAGGMDTELGWRASRKGRGI